MQPLWLNFVSDVRAVIYVVDCAAPDRFGDAVEGYVCCIVGTPERGKHGCHSRKCKIDLLQAVALQLYSENISQIPDGIWEGPLFTSLPTCSSLGRLRTLITCPTLKFARFIVVFTKCDAPTAVTRAAAEERMGLAAVAPRATVLRVNARDPEPVKGLLRWIHDEHEGMALGRAASARA